MANNLVALVNRPAKSERALALCSSSTPVLNRVGNLPNAADRGPKSTRVDGGGDRYPNRVRSDSLSHKPMGKLKRLGAVAP